MQSYIIHKQLLSRYKSIVLEGQPMWTYHGTLTDYIHRNLGYEEATFFSEPQITDGIMGRDNPSLWYSTVLTKNAKPLTAISHADQQKHIDQLSNIIKRLEQFAQELISSGQNANAGKLILKALVIPDLSHVYVENERIVLAAWGFQYANSPQPYQLKELLLSTTGLESTIDNPNGVEIEESKKDKQIDVNILKESYPNKDKKESEGKHVFEDKQESIDIPKYGIDTKKTEKNAETEAHNSEENGSNGDKKFTEEQVKESDQENISISKTKDIPKEKPRQKKKLWLLILLLLLIGVILWWVFIPPQTSILPKQPNVIVPIDSNYVKADSDSIRYIVTNRLNIAITGDNKNLTAFAKAFKKAYPDKEYKIIYYDTLTYRLQIQLPESSLETVKKELPQHLKEFELLIWHESILNNNIVPSDPSFQDAKKAWPFKATQTFNAWDVTQGDPNLIIAVIDDGFDLQHKEFQGRIYKPWNVLSRSPNVNIGRNSHHGTHVAGLALATINNGAGTGGIAPNCKLMPIQVGDYNGRMSTTAIIDGVLYAIHNGAQVINISLGLRMHSSVLSLPVEMQEALIRGLYLEEEKLWTKIFKMAYDKNITVVTSGGNNNLLIGLDPKQRSPYVINVSAIDPSKQKADFSNYGSLSSISAPGVQVYNSIPNNNYAYLDGTSMASPIVAGGIALIKSVNPVLTNKDIIELLQTTGLPINSKNGYVGNLIQLGDALNIASRNRRGMPRVDCPDMQTKIDSFLLEIEKIKAACGGSPTDTLYIPPNTDDLSFTKGTWKSTTSIFNPNTGEKLTLYFNFLADGTGTFAIVEPNNTICKSPLDLALKDNILNINQLGEAVCDPGLGAYQQYYFKCQPDKDGCAICSAQNKDKSENYFDFKLVRINNLNL